MNLEDAYPFEIYKDEHFYAFTTRHKARYIVKFKPSFYAFAAYPLVANNVYEFVIALVEKPPIILPPDERILPTISKIADDFFNTNEKVVIYICDDSDGKGNARKRKFDGWFWYFRGNGYRKFDQSFEEADGYIYNASIIYKMSNPYKYDIIKAFDELADEYKKPK
jgi:Family of unknown function (DUF6169)